MQELLVPTDALEVEIHTNRRERLHGTLFAAPLVERNIAEELAALLNDGRGYLPLRVTDAGGDVQETMIRKSHMTCVRLINGDGTAPGEAADELRFTGPRCHIFLADGESLAGTLDIAVPESHSRIVDRLNRSERFLPVTTSTGPVFINRAQVVQVV